jgi:hypothetical protein
MPWFKVFTPKSIPSIILTTYMLRKANKLVATDKTYSCPGLDTIASSAAAQQLFMMCNPFSTCAERCSQGSSVVRDA